MKIAVVGTGYVGIASTIGLAELGYEMVGFDILTERVNELACGRTPYHEAGLTESLTRHLRSGGVRFTTELSEAVEGASFILIAVGTPTTANGSADLTAVDHVVSALCEFDLNGAIVVLRSTVPAGTSNDVAKRLLGKAEVVYAPEFLREGSAVSDFLDPDRIVVGSRSEAAGMAYAALFAKLDRPTFMMSLLNAELAKGMSNVFLAMKISFANQVANLCDELDGDALDVLAAVGDDRRIGRLFLHPGIGFGGPCFEKDLKSMIHLSKSVATDCDLLTATLNINDRQPGRVVKRLKDHVGPSLQGLTIGVWGLTFKAGTDDVRDSLAVRVVQELANEGADVVAFDPAIKDAEHQLPCRIASSALEAAEAEALVVLTDWPHFAAIDAWSLVHRVRSGLVIDGRNVLDGDAVAAAGLHYQAIGRRRLAEDAELAEAG